MSEYRDITFAIDGHVATVCLNRPDSLNAFNRAMRAELLSALRRVAHDAEIRVLVLGAQGRGFSAGADLGEPPLEGQTVEEQLLEEYGPILRLIGDMDQVVIAAAPGVMAGVGASIAMHCDLTVMADEAAMVMAFTSVGLVPDGGSSWNLLRHLGYQRAFELIAEGGRLEARRCLELGLVNKLAPAHEVLARAQDWARALAQRPPIALGKSKRVLRAAATQSFEETVAAEAKRQVACLASEDSQEAIAAFQEKRAPVFKADSRSTF